MSNITTTPSKPKAKTVGDPIPQYESLQTVWSKARAILNGQNSAKAFDNTLDVYTYKNLLIPFSPKMDHAQYTFYKAEAELPGLVGQYAKVLVGGLLRKPPQFELPKSVPEEASEWLRNNFSAEGNSLIAFLDECLWEELQTSRCWALVEYPEVSIEATNMMTKEQRDALSPYAVMVKAENVINWRKGKVATSNAMVLTKFTIRGYREEYTVDNPHHPTLIDTVVDYALDETGHLIVQRYKRPSDTDQINVVNGQIQHNFQVQQNTNWEADGLPVLPMMHGKRMPFIPAWPLNGSIDAYEPVLQPLIDREVGLYNKISRRNHLLYGAATYTPYIASDMSDEQFDEAVGAGLGSWLHLQKGDTCGALDTPTAALADMEKAIAATIEEMARMGIRMLSPEGSSAESGTALEIRNAAQTAQLGLLNTKVSKTIQSMLKVMIKWKYDVDVEEGDLQFTLSADFNPTPLGADWMRLVTEWYQGGIIPRSVFLQIAKQNDVIPIDYNDDDGKEEIMADPLVAQAQDIDSDPEDPTLGASKKKTKDKAQPKYEETTTIKEY